MSSKYKAVLKALKQPPRDRTRIKPETQIQRVAKQKQTVGTNQYDNARDNLLTLYKPEVVQDILSDFTPAQLEALNIYWTDIQKSLATKINPSKLIILKEISKIV